MAPPSPVRIPRRLPPTAFEWLGANDAFRQAAARGARLIELQRALDAAAGGMRVTVVSITGDCATVSAGSAAAAAKLRQTEPTLRARLVQAGWDIARFRIRTEPPRWQPRPAPRRPKADIPEQGLRSLHALAADAEDGPLKDALARLLRRHRDLR